MAFEEIKAKLGLDVTEFERGVSKAQGALGNVVGQATKKFTDFKQIGQTLATAVGLNLESISEGLARMIVGFSKQQETALLRLVDVSKTAADEMGKIAAKKQGLDDPKKRIQLLDRELESVSQQAKGRTKLTLSEKLSIINQDGYIAGITKINAEEENLAKNQQDAQIRIGQISRERFSAQMEIDDEAAKKSKDNIKEVAALNEQTNKIEEESRQKILTLDQKIAEARAKVEKPISVATSNVEETAKKQAQEKLEKTKAQANLTDLIVEKNKQDQEITDATGKIRESSLNKTLTLEEQILAEKENIKKLEAKITKPLVKSVPISKAPEIKAPEIKVPEINAPEINAPEIKVPEIKAPEIKAPEIKAPEIKAPEIKVPEIKVPEIKAPEIKALEIKAPDKIALFELEKAMANLRELEAKRDKDLQDAANKEKSKTAELEKQTGELRKQIKVKQDDINNSRRQAELPTMADVISGKRNIGGFAKSTASKLEKARAQELVLSDAEQRAREAYAGATTGGAKDAALAQGRGIRARLDQTRGQIGSMEKLLGSRVSDANPYAAMEKELSLVKAELVTLNTTTLASTSTK